MTGTPHPDAVLNEAHTSWLLVSMALVQLMLPGLAFFYAGLLHRTSVTPPFLGLPLPKGVDLRVTGALALRLRRWWR